MMIKYLSIFTNHTLYELILILILMTLGVFAMEVKSLKSCPVKFKISEVKLSKFCTHLICIMTGQSHLLCLNTCLKMYKNRLLYYSVTSRPLECLHQIKSIEFFMNVTKIKSEWEGREWEWKWRGGREWEGKGGKRKGKGKEARPLSDC